MDLQKEDIPDSSITIYKARIVVKGFRQVQDVDYDEIFSLIAMLKSIWIMLAIAAFYEICQFTSKLHSLMDFLKKSCIWCNQKVLSILKVLRKCASSSEPSMDWCKASQSWNIYVDKVIKTYGFIQTCGEACIYKKVSGSTTAFLISICEWHIVDQK